MGKGHRIEELLLSVRALFDDIEWIFRRVVG
jgi:hypothetical protein